MAPGWRLERTYLAGVGFPESRFEGLDLRWADPDGVTAHTALWADNGTGKSTITSLRYALYLPHARDFIRGDSDRSLAKLARSGDVVHVIEQATRVINGEFQRIVIGVVADWPGGSQDLDNPSQLHREFYGWVTGPLGPTIDDLPFHTDAGRWTTRSAFSDAVEALLPDGGAFPAHTPSENQGQWSTWLSSAGVDLEQIRFQSVMNASEGGVDRVMRFADSDAFVRWLISAITDTDTVDMIARSIEQLRANAQARPRWKDELTLWERLTVPLLDLAEAYEEVEGHTKAVQSAAVRAGQAVADADATRAALLSTSEAQRALFDELDRARRGAGTLARTAQRHARRMRLRASHLRAQAAGQLAERRRGEYEAAMRTAAAWKVVADVLARRTAEAKLAGYEQTLDAATKARAEVVADERAARHAVTRLLTDRRDRASKDVNAADAEQRRASAAQKDHDGALSEADREHAIAVERVTTTENRFAGARAVLDAAVEAGTLAADEDPATLDERLAEDQRDAKVRRDGAASQLRNFDGERDAARAEQFKQEHDAKDARGQQVGLGQQLRAAGRRIDNITGSDLFAEVVGVDVDLWTQRDRVIDRLADAASVADADVAGARSGLAQAERTLASLGDGGLLPAAPLVGELLDCYDGVDAWTGWQWLADTLPAAAAERFAAARPDIAGGIVVAHRDRADAVVAAIDAADVDLAGAPVWVGAVLDVEAAISGRDNGVDARVLLPHPGHWDHDEVADMCEQAEAARDVANTTIAAATARAGESRRLTAAVTQLHRDEPSDPRGRLADAIDAAAGRHRDASETASKARRRVEQLTGSIETVTEQRDKASARIDEIIERRRIVGPLVAAAGQMREAQGSLPRLRSDAEKARSRYVELEGERERVRTAVEQASGLLRTATERRDDAVQALADARLTPTVDGPVPHEDEQVLRARLQAAVAALEDVEVDPELRDQVKRARDELGGITRRLDLDPDARDRAGELADTQQARHAAALTSARTQAEKEVEEARTRFAKADAAVDAALSAYEAARKADTGEGRADVDGFPSAALVADAGEADRHAAGLEALAAEQTAVEREKLQNAEAARALADASDGKAQLLDTAADALRDLSDVDMVGQVADDVDVLQQRLQEVRKKHVDAVRQLAGAEKDEQAALDGVRRVATGSLADRVAGYADVHLVDLLQRLRSETALAGDAERLAVQLEQTAASLRDDLAAHEENVRSAAAMLHTKADQALRRLRAYQNQSRLPDGLGEWSGHTFVTIDHEPPPDDDAVAVDRVSRVVHALLGPDGGKSDATALLFGATQALIDAPFRVRVLKPHTDLHLDRAGVSELRNFSGGQRVTAGVLMYATMTKVRASETASIGWLWLDNPFGQASADQFVRTMRRVADKLGLQLLFTAAPKDQGALSMFDRTIVLARRRRPSSGEKIVVVDDASRNVVHLEMVQKNAAAVLG